jgi:hypothetical protein
MLYEKDENREFRQSKAFHSQNIQLDSVYPRAYIRPYQDLYCCQSCGGSVL